MKCKKDNLTYLDIFPDAQLEVVANLNNKFFKTLDPRCIQEIIKAIFDICPPPKWLDIRHSTLCERAVLAVFDGLDLTRFTQYKDKLSNFANLAKNKFPVFVQAKDSEGYIVPGIQSVLGHQKVKKTLKKYPSYEEMIATQHDLLDNGYPMHLDGLKIPENPKCKLYNIQILQESELTDFHELPETVENEHKIIAIDCEMIETKIGSELARLSVVDENGNTLIDQFFKPKNEVVDYRTQFSGITEETLSQITTPPEEALQILAKFASKNTIIAGHSLENDLRALKLIHLRCIDTALLYLSETNYVKKPSLILLYSKHIKKPFRQNSQNGHDSTEDAKAAMELVKYLLIDPKEYEKTQNKLPDLISEIIRKHGPIFYTGWEKNIDFKPQESLKIKGTKSDEDCYSELFENIQQFDFNVAHFYGLSDIDPIHEDKNVEIEKIEKYNKLLGDIIRNLPKRTILIVYAPNGNLNRLKSETETNIPPMIDDAKRSDFLEVRQGIMWIHCSESR